jgi:sensor histidine kinase YesM
MKSKFTKLPKREKITHLCLLTLLTIIFSYLLLGEVYLRDPLSILVTTPTHFILGHFSASVQFEVMFVIRKKFPHYHQNLFRVTTIILAWAIMTALTVLIVFNVYDALNIYQYELNQLKLGWCFAIGFLFNFFYAIIFEAFYIEKRWGDDVREKEALRQANLVSQFESLKAQVNPHFLFNCLNSLSSLISQNPVKAEEFVDEMSNVYRYLLRTNENGLVSIETEIQFIRSYYHLQKTRFGEAIELDIRLSSEDLETLIPSLTLQMLLENAVKHNSLRKTSPLRIEIFKRQGFIVVRNNIQSKSKQYIISTKIGLQNISSKYQLINKSDIHISNDGQYFEVSLPLISNVAYKSIEYDPIDDTLYRTGSK